MSEDKIPEPFENRESVSFEKPPQQDESQTITIKKSTYSNLLKGAVFAIAIAAFFGGYLAGNLDDSNQITSEELKAVISEIQKQQVASSAPQPTAQQAAPQAPQIFKVSIDDDPIKGDSDAPVTIVEFSDFQCPFCGRFYQQTLPAILEDYVDTGKVKFVYRDLPLNSIHPNAMSAHIAAECADEQGEFWEYHDVLFEKQQQWQRLPESELRTTFVEYAADAEINTDNFESCLSSQEIADEVNKDMQEARQLGITGTPSFFIGNDKDGYTKLTGAQPYESFKIEIDKLLSS